MSYAISQGTSQLWPTELNVAGAAVTSLNAASAPRAPALAVTVWRGSWKCAGRRFKRSEIRG